MSEEGGRRRASRGHADPEVVDDFEDWVRTRGPALARTARLLVDDPHAADDLVQTVLERALVSWARIRQADDVDAYLYRSLVNARNRWWRRQRRETPTDQVPDRAAAVSGTGGDREMLTAALRRLSRQQRAVLVLRYYEDLGEAQVAAILDCSVGTVRTHAARGRHALRLALTGPEDRPGRRDSPAEPAAGTRPAPAGDRIPQG